MDRKLAAIYESIQDFNYQKPEIDQGQKQLNRRVEDARENVSGAINGLINYYKMLVRKVERDRLNVGHVEELEKLDQFTRQHLNQFRHFGTGEESFE